MKVKALDEFHLLVIVSATEAEYMGLNLESLRMNTLACRLTIARLFAAACQRTGFDSDPARGIRDILQKVHTIEIHAMSTVDGQWVLLFSTHPSVRKNAAKARKVYRIKRMCGPYCYRMASCGDALNVLERLFRSGVDSRCKLVCWEQQYFLIVSPKCRNLLQVKALLLEYGSLWGKGQAVTAFLLEHGHLLASNAIDQVGPCLV